MCFYFSRRYCFHFTRFWFIGKGYIFCETHVSYKEIFILKKHAPICLTDTMLLSVYTCFVIIAYGKSDCPTHRTFVTGERRMSHPDIPITYVSSLTFVRAPSHHCTLNDFLILLSKIYFEMVNLFCK